jgi:hypothetical protein
LATRAYAIPLRHSVGLARWWHFSVNLLWTINGIAFFVLLFVTDQWQRLVPLILLRHRQTKGAETDMSELRNRATSRLYKDDAQADPMTLSGKADTVGYERKSHTQTLRRGGGDGMYTRKAYATRETPPRDQG